MIYRTTVLPNGRIDADALPDLPPGAQVEVKIERTVESLHATLKELAQIGRECSQEVYTGPYNRQVIYEDHD